MANLSINPSRNFRPFSAARELVENYEQQSPAVLAIAEQAIGGVLIADGVFGSANPFTAGRKNGVWGNFISLLVGIGLLIFFPFFVNTLNYDAYTAKTAATVTNVIEHTSVRYEDGHRRTSRTCELVVSFTADGRTYTNSARSSSSGYCAYNTGSGVQIQYNPADPTQWDTPAGIQGFGLVKLLFTIIPWIVVVTSAWGLLLKSAAIVFGIILWRRGHALAQANPTAHVDAQQIKAQVQDFFQRRLWGFNG